MNKTELPIKSSGKEMKKNHLSPICVLNFVSSNYYFDSKDVANNVKKNSNESVHFHAV